MDQGESLTVRPVPTYATPGPIIVDSVAVIGAGVSGLVTAKRLASEGFQIEIFERRSHAGGLWNFSPDPNHPFASAVYGDLQTNFPRQLMELQDCPWTTQPLFMKHNVVEEYLERYAQQVQWEGKASVRFNFNTEVVRLFHESSGHIQDYWELNWRSVLTGERGTSRYRYVIVAVGIFDEPFIPNYEGLPTWREMWRNSISHAKAYRNPDAFRDKNVLIVGYQASGFDIASKIAGSVSRLWISSTRPPAGGLPSNTTAMTAVFCFYPVQRMIRFTDGKVISEVDHVIFCTGYQYHQPFIKASRHSEEPLFPSGPNIDGLHEHIIYVQNPSLAFIGMVRDAVPTFLVVQAQAAFVSRFFCGLLQSLRQRKEESHHRLPYPLFMDYLLRLESLCEEADKGRRWRLMPTVNPVFHWTWELDLIRTKRRKIREMFFAHIASTNGVWSTGDTIHEYHSKLLSLKLPNIRALVPFLILYCGYKSENEANLVLPFQGWEAGLGSNLAQCIRDEIVALSSQLEQDSQDVLTRGSNKLRALIVDRWSTFNGQTRAAK